MEETMNAESGPSDTKAEDTHQSDKPSWDEVFAALDAADFPADFLRDRDHSLPQVHEDFSTGGSSVDPLGNAREQPRTAKVFMSGRSQAVRIPAEYRFTKKEVYIRRDPYSGDLILSEKLSWEEIFAELRAAKIPPDFFGDRDQGEFEKREELL